MLRELVIKDFVIVESQYIHLNNGLVAITGETGTGKSLIIDALSLLKGGRAAESMIRCDRKSALIEGLFDLSLSPDLKEWLEKNELSGEIDGEVVLSREILRDGRNRARINGRSVPVGLLKEAGSMLIDIYGQREHERFLAGENQLAIIDVFLGAEGEKVRDKYVQRYLHWSQLRRELEQLVVGDLSRENELRFIIQEFEELGFTPEKLIEIEEEFRDLAHVQSYCSALDRALVLVEGSLDEKGISFLISLLKNELEKIPAEGKYSSLAQAVENLRNMETELHDVASEVAMLRNSLDYSPEKIEMLERTVTEIERLKRKYRCRTTEDLVQFRNQVEERVQEVERQIEKKKEVENEVEKAHKELIDIGEKLSQSRRDAAKVFESRFIEELAQLAFQHVQFKVNFAEVPSEDKPFFANGRDSIEFHISLNPGQPLGPVMEVASGGELSRIVLAVKSIAMTMKNLPVMIFDEIDQGVGGKTAFWIGEKLHEIASGRQVICVTHLPQIACFADYHVRVDKFSDSQNTWAEITPLQDKEKRLQELARMMGGENSAIPAMQFAETLLRRAGNKEK